MTLLRRCNYYRRIFSAYLGKGTSQLTFWHEPSQVNGSASAMSLGPYYMRFQQKADYGGPFDAAGIPLLDYRGALGPQYNPIAIAQYGLGNYNCFCESGDQSRREKFLRVAEWLLANLEPNPAGLWVWNHHFDWEYRTRLIAPWYSALAQGQGISVLVRAHAVTGEDRFLEAARRALGPFLHAISSGGVAYQDEAGRTWFEEYVVSPPTHILNGFIWGSWGLHDLALATGDETARHLFAEAVQTIRDNLHRYDTGFWSLYELSGTRLPMIASSFYHQLHIVQLQVMHLLTGDALFEQYARRWKAYAQRRANRSRAFLQKAVFKLAYY
jgi:heparosan-N-sulfate-glucuronate 5-epimerase